VPLASARLDNVVIRYAKGVHGGLPNIPSVYLDVFNWLRGKPLKLPDSAEGALSGHMGGLDRSDAPHLDGTADASQYSDDAGLWNVDVPPAGRLDVLKQKLDKAALPEFTRVRAL